MPPLLAVLRAAALTFLKLLNTPFQTVQSDLQGRAIDYFFLLLTNVKLTNLIFPSNQAFVVDVDGRQKPYGHSAFT